MFDDKDGLVELAADVVAAYVVANKVAVAELPHLIHSVYGALKHAGSPVDLPGPVEEPIKLTLAQIRRSIMPEALISFIDGRPYKTLKRHLSRQGITVAQYKAKFGLPADYPMTAQTYSAARSAMARANGLGQGGRKPKAKKA